MRLACCSTRTRLAAALCLIACTWGGSSGADTIEASADQTSWRVAAGTRIDIDARIENHGSSTVFLNGISWTLDPDRTWTIDASPFLNSGPAILGPYEIWEGTLVHADVPGDASSGQTLMDVAVLGGAAEDEATLLCTVTARIFVNLPGCDPVIRSQPSDTLVQAGQPVSFTIGLDQGNDASFQWMKDGVDLSDNGSVTGSQTPTLRVLACAADDAGFYTVRALNSCGEALSTPARLTVQQTTSADSDIPRIVSIEAITPNPASSFEMIRWTLPMRTSARLEVFDSSGRRRRTLVSEESSAGRHWTLWDGRDDRGLRMAAGVYFVRLDAARRSLSRKCVLVR